MDLSELEAYPVSSVFTFDDGRGFGVTSDANYFTRANMRAFERRVAEAKRAALKPLTERMEALQAETARLAEKEKGKKAPAKASEKRLREIADEAEALADEFFTVAESAERTAYAAELADKVSLGWDVTEGDNPVPVTAEVLAARPLLLLRDLYAHCRESALPKTERDQKKAKSSGTTTSPATGATLSSPTIH